MKKRIFSILLTLALVLTLLPAAAFADDAVATDGTNTYGTLAEAVAAVAPGGTVTLLRDTEITGSLSVTKALTLDLGGFTLSRDGAGYVMAVGGGGDLTLKNGNVTITGNGEGDGAIYLYPGKGGDCNLVLEHGTTVTALSSYGVVLFGNQSADTVSLTVRGKIEAGASAISGNGIADYAGTDITIEDGAELISNNSVAIYHPQSGTLTVNGGSITGKGGIEAKSGDSKVTVKGATITATGDVDHTASGSGNSTSGYAVAVVENSAYAGKPTFEIMDGSFYGPVAVLSDNYVPADKLGSITVSGGSFTDLAGAVKYAAPGAEIKLLQDTEITGNISVTKELTLDLGGFTLSKDGAGNVFAVGGGSDLTLKNGKISITNNNSGDSAVRIAADANGNAKATIASDVTIEAPSSYGVVVFGDTANKTTASLTMYGTVTARNAAVSGNGLRSGTDITLEDGADLTSTDSVAVYHPQKGTLTVKGAKLTGKGGIEAKSGDAVVTVEDAVITATAEPTHKPSNNGPSTEGYAVAVVENRNYAGDPTVAIENGTYHGKIAVLKDDEVGESPNPGHITVSGGRFSEPVESALLADSLKAQLHAGGFYTYYPTVESALAAAERTGGTVTALNTQQTVTITLVGVHAADTTVVVNQGSSLTLPQLAKSGAWTHTAWKDAAGKTYVPGTAYSAAASATLTAVWQAPETITPVGPAAASVSAEKTEHGSVTVSPKAPAAGDTVTITATPDSGYVLETITAESRQGELELTLNADGTYSFVMPAGSVTVKATFMEDNSLLNFFYDVPTDSYCYEAVKWAVEKNITTGVGGSLFDPEGTCTRSQMVTFLWRAAGSPIVDDAPSFTDVPADAWYAQAVRWAAANGIANGVGDGRFDPDGTCTRGQMAALLYRFMQSPAVTGEHPFTDVTAADYYNDAVLWAYTAGVTQGTSATAFSPAAPCTRGQMVTFLYRLLAEK